MASANSKQVAVFPSMTTPAANLGIYPAGQPYDTYPSALTHCLRPSIVSSLKAIRAIRAFSFADWRALSSFAYRHNRKLSFHTLLASCLRLMLWIELPSDIAGLHHVISSNVIVAQIINLNPTLSPPWARRATSTRAFKSTLCHHSARIVER